MWMNLLDFIVVLSLSFLLTLIILFQEGYLINVKESISKNKFVLSIQIIRMLLGIWVIFVTETNLMAVSKAVAIQLTILVFLWSLSKYVQKYKGNWLITIVAFIAYGIGSYFYIMFAFID
ncbi:hypothetical protein BK704_33770 [[Bacillus thuringiensis] serovar konkukian]|nr:hypothetical protein [Bacillus thuringiensis]MED1305288.1 hypothetical protein [Bacillus pacificus]OUA92394.1 hypothetical protein BK704_33770 [[Bacillus thuringiensis] serovar konkukian]